MDRRRVLLIAATVIALLGTALVFVYVRGADTRAEARFEAVTVLRAVKAIAPGETIEAAQAAGSFEESTVTQGDLLTGAVADPVALAGQVATVMIFPGEQLLTTKFGAPGTGSGLNIPDGKLAISVNLTDPARVAGFVDPGAEVSIFMTGQGQDGSFTRMLLPKVQVIGVGTTTVVPTTTTDSTGAQTTEQLPRTLLTLALDQAEAEKVLYASSTGELAFALLNKKSQVAPSRGVTGSNLFN